MANFDDLLTERKTMEACLHKTTFDLINLQKIRVHLRSDDEKQSIEDLLYEKANYLLMLQTLGESIAATQPPQVVNPIAAGGPSKSKDLKFPSGLVFFDAEKTILPEWLAHTHRVLVTANFDFHFRVNVLMHQVSKDKDVFEWVGTNIVDTGLDWKHAEAAFCDKYGTVCVEEIALDKLWALKYTDFLSTTAFLSSIAACCKGAGVPHDQFLFVSFALQFMNPAVSSLVRFSKQPGKKLSWVELLASVRDQEHNIRIGVVAPNFNPYREGEPRRDKDKSKLRPDPIPPASTDGDTKPKAEWKLTKTCHTCGVKGHISPECPQMEGKEGKAAAADPLRPPVFPKPQAVHRPQLLVAAGSVKPPSALTDDAVDAALREMCGLPVVGQLMVYTAPFTDGFSHSGFDVDLPPPLPPGDLLRVPCEVNGRQIWAVVDCAALKTSLSSTFVASFPSGIDLSLADPQPVLLQFGDGATTPPGRYLRLDRFRFGHRELSDACCYEALFPSFLGGVDLWIGLDLFPSLGLSVHGLPVTFPAPVVLTGASGDSYDVEAIDSGGSQVLTCTNNLSKGEDTHLSYPVSQYPVSKIAEPFGLNTVTAVFRAVMEAIFAGIFFVMAFCDDILVFTNTTLTDHARHVRACVALLNTNRLPARSSVAAVHVVVAASVAVAAGIAPVVGDDALASVAIVSPAVAPVVATRVR